MASRPPFADLTGISLCAGYAGLDLGLAVAAPSYRTVCYVEREAHAAAAIVARMADKALAAAPVWDNLKTFDGRPWRDKVHILSAGYPCQPFSVAGNRKGKRDPRHLWPDVARIIDEVQPRCVVLENVEGHIDLGFAEVAAQLQELGYHAKAGLFTAREVGARHRRRRLFILAYAHGERCGLFSGTGGRRRPAFDQEAAGHSGGEFGAILDGQCDPRLDYDLDACSGSGPLTNAEIPVFSPGPAELQAWQKLLSRRPDLQPALLRDDDGLADRLDRTRGVGNGVVSLQAAYALRTLDTAFAR